MGRPASDKRERLVAAAVEQIHRTGYARTSLADVAKVAGMSAGNVFYYFKAKDDLAKAVIDEWCRQLTDHMGLFDAEGSAWTRLERFVEQAGALREMYVTMGCPLAGLSRDLRRENDALQREVPRVYAIQYRWLEAQFGELGYPPREAVEHARFLMASFHGALLLAYAQGDDALIASAVASLRAWLRQLRARRGRGAPG